MKIMTNNGFMTKVMGLAKGVLPFYLLTLLPFCASAQISKHVTVDSVGQLAKQIDNEEKFKISSLSVSGPLNSADVKLLQQIVNRAKASEKKGECVVTSVDLSGAVFTEGKEAKATTTLPNGLFSGAKQLVKVILPQGITAISKSCFDGCSSLPDIQIPSSVTAIENQAFQGCESLTAIAIPSGVTAIGNEAFENCKSLTQVEIPENVTELGNQVFNGCK
ncbi:MAG: leucine-rich repeat domain-containing protein, partial [Prevotella sp.]|nr:leucine-rich repeat domain-containing protein [Prevotella sp.]